MSGQRPDRHCDIRRAQHQRIGMKVANAQRKVLGDETHWFNNNKQTQFRHWILRSDLARTWNHFASPCIKL